MEINYTKTVPKAIQERTIENIEVYHLSLTDAFEEAVKELAKKGTELWKAWYYGCLLYTSISQTLWLAYGLSVQLIIIDCFNNSLRGWHGRDKRKRKSK